MRFSTLLPTVALFVTSANAVVWHTVAFKYTSSAQPADKTRVVNDFLALEASCVLPNGNPCIRSIEAGENFSQEGNYANSGFEHVFQLKFRNEAARQYYLNEDASHAAFKDSLAGVAEDIFVTAFIPGAF